MPIGDAGELKERSLSNYDWKCGKEYREIRYELCDGVAKISINRPERRNAFTPLTVMEMYDAFSEARDDASVGDILLTGVNHGGRHEDEAFCSGGDQKKRGNGGYVGEDNIPRLNVLDLQRLIRVVPKPVIAMVNGYAIGGGPVLSILCDLTIAADTAKLGQTGPKVGSFDAGYGAGYLAAIVGQKKAREIWYLCRQYTADEALEMGLVNKVVPFDDLEDECMAWAAEMMQFSPTALRFMKASFNAATDGLAGIQQLAGDATLPPISVPMASVQASTERSTPEAAARLLMTGTIVAAKGILSTKALAIAEIHSTMAIISMALLPLIFAIKPAISSRIPVCSSPPTTINRPIKNSRVL